MRLRDLAGKNVAVWGAGVEGRATAEAAQKIGAHVTLAVDQDISQPTIPSADGVQTVYGATAIQTILGADIVIKSPGISRQHPLLAKLSDKHVFVTSSTELWMADHAYHTIGVTGSKGKSTTSSLLAHLMQALGFDVALGGNIGMPLLSLPGDKAWYVAELSSFQCATIKQSPWGAVFTSLFPDHLDWHGDLEDYYQSKMNLAAHSPQAVFANGTSQELRYRLPLVTPMEQIRWSDTGRIHIEGDAIMVDGQAVIHEADSPLIGKHNFTNLCLAIMVLDELGINLIEQRADVLAALKQFYPLEHRLELVSNARQLRWINDSLSTNPHAAIAALEAFEDEPVALIVGGQDRGVDYEPLQAFLLQRTAPTIVLTIPDNGTRITAGLNQRQIQVVHCKSLEDAVEQAANITPRHGIVLMSPAAPSFGRFKNYQERAEAFQKYIAAIGSTK